MKQILKKINLIFCLLVIFVGCTNQSKLFYSDNSQFQEDYKSNELCRGLAEAIRSNFFYNSEDSIYIENYGFYIHSLTDEYVECLRGLTEEQFISLFGTPHLNKDGVLYYVIKKMNKRQKDVGINRLGVRTFLTDAKKLPVSQIILDNEPNSEFKIPSLLLNQTNLKKVHSVKLKRKERSKLETNSQLDECSYRKYMMKNEIFFDKKRNIYIINSLFSNLVGQMNKEPLPCKESFTKQEIVEIFGTPTKMINDTLYFATWDKPYKNVNMKHPDWVGKVFTVIFTKTEKGFFRLDLDMVNTNILFE